MIAWLKKRVHAATMGLMRLERRIDPFFRPCFDELFREAAANLTQRLINRRRAKDDTLKLAEETVMPGEADFMSRIIAEMSGYMKAQYRPGQFERAGNTKTHAIVRGEFIVKRIDQATRGGIFSQPATFKAWIRFSGPGPASPPDIDDVGILSIGVKLMGVPGKKMLEDEKGTQDFTGISAPTFTTPNVRENAKLQAAIRRGLPLFYFLNFTDSHLLDGIMQGLWARTQSSPLETRYWSCSPYLLGEGCAMQYSFRPCSTQTSRVPRLPLRPPDSYLREAMVRTLQKTDVEFDFLIQRQTDPWRMPIEDCSVMWPESLSPPVVVATLRLPRQKFDSPAQLAFARNLSFNPWHCIPEHRPMGNQNRARKTIYMELSRYRQKMDATPHVEPTGDETF